MAPGNQTHAFRIAPGTTTFVRFVLDVIDLLQRSEPHGLDQDGFLNTYFMGQGRGSPPTSQADRDAWWETFKQAVKYSNDRFGENISPFAWIRARPGPRRGQYFYQIVGQRDGNRVKIEGDAANLSQLDDFTDRRWHTQTESRQRVRASRALALISAGQRSGDQRLTARGANCSTSSLHCHLD